MITRRSLITGIATFLAAPAIVRASSLMPVKAWDDGLIKCTEHTSPQCPWLPSKWYTSDGKLVAGQPKVVYTFEDLARGLKERHAILSDPRVTIAYADPKPSLRSDILIGLYF